MDFFTGKKTSSADPSGEHHEKSSPELVSRAKLVAEAAQCTLNNESDKVDKGKVAGASADLLGAAKDYGKLGEEGVGKYVVQAENYLQQYESSNTTTTETPTAVTDAAASAAIGDVKAPASGTAKDYSKLGEEGVGKYVDQAENYLHQYESSNTTTTDTPTAVTDAAASAGIGDIKTPASGTDAAAPAAVTDSAAQSTLENEMEKVSKDKVTGAAADLHQCQSSTVTDAVAPAAVTDTSAPAVAYAPPPVSGGDKGNSGTDYLKMAQGYIL